MAFLLPDFINELFKIGDELANLCTLYLKALLYYLKFAKQN